MIRNYLLGKLIVDSNSVFSVVIEVQAGGQSAKKVKQTNSNFSVNCKLYLGSVMFTKASKHQRNDY